MKYIRITDLVKNHYTKLLKVFISAMISSMAVLSFGYIFRSSINESKIFNINNSYVLAAAIVILAIASFFRVNLINKVAENIAGHLRLVQFSALLNSSISAQQSFTKGDLIMRVNNDTQVVKSAIITFFSFFVRNILMLIGGFAMLFYTNSYLTINSFAVFFLALIPTIFLIKRLKILAKYTSIAEAELTEKAQEIFSSLKFIKAYSSQLFELNRFNETSSNLEKAFSRKIFLRSIFVSLVIVLIGLSLIYVFFLGKEQVLSGKFSAGDLVAFLFYMLVVASSLGGMSEVVADYTKANESLKRISEICALPHEQQEKSLVLINEINKIKFENVSFAYNGGQNIIDNISFEIKNGQKIAIVGKSGAGKTTILELILGLHDNFSGSITINDVDIRDLNKHEYRKLIGYIPQEPVIFSGTIIENTIYDKKAKEEKALIALEDANFTDYLQKLPSRENTFISNSEHMLSGGMKQLVALSRVFIRDPKLLLLDEATSNLDKENQGAVSRAILRLTKNKTTIVISHQLVEKDLFDQIISIKF